MLEAKKTNTLIEKTNLTTKNHYFSLKNDPGWQKNLEHREKFITAIQNERVLWKAMTLLQKRMTLFENQFCS